MKGTLAKNRHVLLPEGGDGRRGGVGALTAFISINKMERFTRGPLLRALSGGRRESYTLTAPNEFISVSGSVERHCSVSSLTETCRNLDVAPHNLAEVDTQSP